MHFVSNKTSAIPIFFRNQSKKDTYKSLCLLNSADDEHKRFVNEASTHRAKLTRITKWHSN